METAVLIPVKAFRAAKARLADRIAAADRERLARFMAEQVVRAAGPAAATFVACDDDDVAAWAEQLGAQVLWGPGLGLNGAIDQGVDTIAGKGIDHVVISHGDLPLASRLGALAQPDRVVLVPDRRRDGTNVLARPCAVPIAARYGAGSFQAHLAAALATGVPVSVRVDHRLALDIDTIDDCRHPLVDSVLRPLLGAALDR